MAKTYQTTNTYSDIFAAEPFIPMMFPAERETNGALKVLSLFSGCGGMDLGFEGNFICHIN